MSDYKKKEEYLQALINEPFPLMGFLRKSEIVRNDICPSIGKEAGQLLYFLIKLTKAKNILEIGTSIGYSTIWLALGAKDNKGHLDTIEVTKRLSEEAERNLSSIKLDSYTTFYQGYAEEIVDKMKDKYDLIFIDSSTKSYYKLYEKSLLRLKVGGLIVFENILFPSMDKRVAQREMMDILNKKIKDDIRITSCYLNIGDGILLCLKK